jgi:hypothetical protein
MFNLIELQLMRQSLDVITIVGKDAKTVANLQTKLEQVIQEESIKQQQLQQTLAKNKK